MTKDDRKPDVPPGWRELDRRMLTGCIVMLALLGIPALWLALA